MRLSHDPWEVAESLLKRSNLPVQMAAVLSDKHGVFAWGWNSGWTHAEQMALGRANPKRLAGATLTVLGRRKKSRNLLTSKPCTRRGCWQLANNLVAYVQWYDSSTQTYMRKATDDGK